MDDIRLGGILMLLLQQRVRRIRQKFFEDPYIALKVHFTRSRPPSRNFILDEGYSVSVGKDCLG